MKNLILDTFPDIEAGQRKKYVGFYLKNDTTAICTITIKKEHLHLSYSTSKPGVIPVDSFVIDYTNKGQWGIGNYVSRIKNEHDMERAIPLVKKIHLLKTQ